MCDLAQPKCGRCARIGNICAGGGTIRFKFQQYEPDSQVTATPSRGLDNEASKLAAEFVCLMEIDDVRYSLGKYGPYFFIELPSRLGSHPAMDATTSALTTSFKSIRLRKTCDLNVLAVYGKALRTLQDCLSDPEQPAVQKLELVLMTMLCQLWIDNKHSNKHRGVIAHLLKEAVSQGQTLHLGDIRAWCLQAVYAALCVPQVELGSWFWDVAIQDVIMTRPYHYEQNLYCFELGAIADLPVFLRDPERYLYQLKCYFNILSQERPMMRELHIMSMSRAFSPDATLDHKEKAVENAAGHAALLLQSGLIAPTLKQFGVLSNYTEASHEICDEAILLAHQCQPFRPCGASYCPELLKVVWAALDDGYRHEELETLISSYGDDVQGADYIGEAKAMRKRLDSLGWSNKDQVLPENDERLETPPCVIL
ncbi:hypothetical protein BKA59DRAFT_527644 [Fusarium tricinctum]|uniref:Zn(2)-C6 fungal-type domain-containing protein n=1 Tax=Fusarium tricinctum TaxID=61284 RepID=A0A8K0WBE8_9HYPO|nr:hypothetical protein BKA59DRAFT_527644 [Fusarium tricinctum]